MTRPATETAHVLMTDRVGYSKVSIEERAALDQELLDAVRSCPTVVRQTADQCLKLDSGDGVSLVFFGEPTDAAEAALYLHTHVSIPSRVKLRIGLHSGLVTRREDANGKTNVSGPGIEKAQRAMACADGSQVVATEYFAENLRAFSDWRELLIDLGKYPVKHGDELRLFAIGSGGGHSATGHLLPADPGRKVAILYRRRAQPDDYVVELLEERLSELGFGVFIDRHLSIGVKWAQAIEQEIRGADAVVVVLSEKASVSEMVLFELQTALDQLEQTGSPKVLPVRVGEDTPLDGEIGILLRPFHYANWRSSEDDVSLIDAVSRAIASPEEQSPPPSLERVGGAMPLGSPYYVERPTDGEFVSALRDRDSIVLVKGARQIGKTSLMARSLRRATESGAKVVWTDMQSFSRAQIESDEKLYLSIALEFVDQLELECDPIEKWRPMFGPNTNFERFLESSVLSVVSEPVVWAIDEVDRLFTLPFSSDFFGMIRSWHNRRAARAQETWNRFTVALAYATEAHLFISDLNQSPFNVGTRLELNDFDEAQLADLNERYGGPLKSLNELARFRALVGGQPYLTRRGLDEMVRHERSLDQLESVAPVDEGPFGDHLRRLLVALSNDSVMLQEVRELLSGRPIGSEEVFLRLRSGGLLMGPTRTAASFRCGIYAAYLRRFL